LKEKLGIFTHLQLEHRGSCGHNTPRMGGCGVTCV